MCLFIYFHCTGLLCTLNMAFEIRLVTLLYNRCINVGKDVYIMYVCMFADMCACVYLTLAPFFSLYVRLRVNCGADVLRVNSIKPKRKRYSRFDAFSMRFQCDHLMSNREIQSVFFLSMTPLAILQGCCTVKLKRPFDR